MDKWKTGKLVKLLDAYRNSNTPQKRFLQSSPFAATFSPKKSSK